MFCQLQVKRQVPQNVEVGLSWSPLSEEVRRMAADRDDFASMPTAPPPSPTRSSPEQSTTHTTPHENTLTVATTQSIANTASMPNKCLHIDDHPAENSLHSESGLALPLSSGPSAQTIKNPSRRGRSESPKSDPFSLGDSAARAQSLRVEEFPGLCSGAVQRPGSVVPSARPCKALLHMLEGAWSGVGGHERQFDSLDSLEARQVESLRKRVRRFRSGNVHQFPVS